MLAHESQNEWMLQWSRRMAPVNTEARGRDSGDGLSTVGLAGSVCWLLSVVPTGYTMNYPQEWIRTWPLQTLSTKRCGKQRSNTEKPKGGFVSLADFLVAFSSFKGFTEQLITDDGGQLWKAALSVWAFPCGHQPAQMKLLKGCLIRTVE